MGLYICGFTPLWSENQARNSVSKRRSKKTDKRKKLCATFPINKEENKIIQKIGSDSSEFKVNA